MTRLARSGNRVLFVENTGVRSPKIKDIGRIKKRISNWINSSWGFREIEKNLSIFSPIVLPFPYSRFAQWFNTWFLIRLIKTWMESVSFHDPIIWTFLPTPLTLNLIRQIKHELVIYYCIDSFVDSSSAAKRIVASEERLFSEADLVFVTSHNLLEKGKRFNENTHIFPFAVDLEGFQARNGLSHSTPEDMENIKGPIIGYVGGIHQWIDFELIADVAEERPGWNFVLVGPVQTAVKPLENIENVFFLGAKTHAELPDYVANFDVCLIPYRIAEYTKNVYPTKLTEYLALGKPVISTPIVEIQKFCEKYPGLVEMADDKNGFIDRIEKCLSNNCVEDQEKRIKVAEENTWSGHLEKMSDLIIEKISEKATKPVLWQVQFKTFYYSGRRKFFKYLASFLAVWVFCFHTSFVWLLARPLLIQNPPEKADLIAVLGGGVGESGEAGQGYAERTKRAIDLYKAGLSPFVLLVSGYTYMMQEAEMMRGLGVEFGIPEDRIFMETKASSTYQSIVAIANMAKERNLNRIMLISSPFHMRRVQLCFKKIAPNLQIIYVPARSGFYGWPGQIQLISWGSQISLKQINGLAHEIFGIMYYFYRGYI